MSLTFKSADILLPKKNIDLHKWSVVACDQYTSEPEYWQQVSEIAGDEPSTYNLVLPEVYLGDADETERLDRITCTMDHYIAEGLFEEYKNAMIYVERTDSSGKVRAGIIGAIDLEQYDYHKGSMTKVRATEATVIERIPPRIKVRERAKIELPHIMILIDDSKKTVIEPLSELELPVLYDFELMQGGGHLVGKLIDEKIQKSILESLDVLGSHRHFEDKPVLLYAMGDGNHSLATAKEFYEQLKAANPDRDMSDHPARYALVEIVNLHSPALEFEPIHRIITDTDEEKIMSEMKDALGLRKAEGDISSDEQVMTVVKGDKKQAFVITKPVSKLTVGSLQSFLDSYVKEHGCGIDYIHGEEVIRNLSSKDGNIGFLLPVLGKEELFPTVIIDGALPRKTFSMGHAQDKRFYMECRKITE